MAHSWIATKSQALFITIHAFILYFVPQINNDRQNGKFKGECKTKNLESTKLFVKIPEVIIVVLDVIVSVDVVVDAVFVVVFADVVVVFVVVVAVVVVVDRNVSLLFQSMAILKHLEPENTNQKPISPSIRFDPTIDGLIKIQLDLIW